MSLHSGGEWIDIKHPDPDPDLDNQEEILTKDSNRDNHSKSNNFNKFNKSRITKAELDPMKERTYELVEAVTITLLKK